MGKSYLLPRALTLFICTRSGISRVFFHEGIGPHMDTQAMSRCVGILFVSYLELIFEESSRYYHDLSLQPKHTKMTLDHGQIILAL